MNFALRDGLKSGAKVVSSKCDSQSVKQRVWEAQTSGGTSLSSQQHSGVSEKQNVTEFDAVRHWFKSVC